MLSPRLADVQFPKNGPIRLSDNPAAADSRSTQDIDLAVLVENHPYFEDELTKIGLKPVKSKRWTDPGVVRVSQWVLSLEDQEDQYVDCNVDFLTSTHSFHREAIEHSLVVDFIGVERKLRVLTLEDLLLFKAASGRMIDLADIRTLCQIHKELLDIGYLEAKSQELNLPLGFWNPAAEKPEANFTGIEPANVHRVPEVFSKRHPAGQALGPRGRANGDQKEAVVQS